MGNNWGLCDVNSGITIYRYLETREILFFFPFPWLYVAFGVLVETMWFTLNSTSVGICHNFFLICYILFIWKKKYIVQRFNNDKKIISTRLLWEGVEMLPGLVLYVTSVQRICNHYYCLTYKRIATWSHSAPYVCLWNPLKSFFPYSLIFHFSFQLIITPFMYSSVGKEHT